MRRHVLKNPFITSSSLRNEIPELANVSNSNLSQILNKKLHLPGSRPKSKPAMTPLHVRNRLAFCMRVRHWTVEDWKRVMWSDESTFKLFRDNRIFI